jgi:hypothetical protein
MDDGTRPNADVIALVLGGVALLFGFMLPCVPGRRGRLVLIGLSLAIVAGVTAWLGSTAWAISVIGVVILAAGLFGEFVFAAGGPLAPVRLPEMPKYGSESQTLDLEFPAKILIRWRGPFMCTDFLAELANPRHLRIASRGWVGSFFADSKLAAVDVGAWTYAVHSTDPAFAAALLTSPARKQIEELDRLHDGALLVEQRPSTFVVRAEGTVDDGVPMEEFVRLCAALARRLRDLTPTEREETIAKAACGVCGTELGYRTVTCAACDTPHHRECWEYNAGCSVYACGGRDARP